ncbi:Actin-like protein arp5 [Vanrija pseudolonga]|uniref:Actin-like protein arp5 n=1 Tax=Vanrija pseudolonga TaxID=143232 RepID=A0AAF0YFS8_9TREE|nr:Actin-like protein arp5 [Vanrija pseudolonga]
MAAKTEPHAGSSSTPTPDNVIYLPENHFSGEPQPVFDYHSLDGKDPVICIDNGSHAWRAGFSTMDTPYIDRPNIVSRYRDRKLLRNTLLFGNDVEVDANSRSNGRCMFDGDMLIHGDLMESALDYTFLTLGIDSSSIEQPIVMTERLANPIFTRAMTSEILFELYGAPEVSYGIDSLFAFSRHKKQDGLAINLGHNASTIIPVVDGKGILSRAKRIPWGGAQAADLMLKLTQLKYPSFPVKVTNSQATFMYRETCYFSSDYEEELRSLTDPVKMMEQTKVIQFPFNQPEVIEKTEEEIAAALERRREQGKRLQDMQAKQRAEKLAAQVAELEEYKTILGERSKLKKADFIKRVSEVTPFDTEAELEAWVNKTEAEVRRKQRRAAGEEPEPEEEPSFPLVDRPDEELTEEEIKDKRRQKLMKAGWEARVKIREEKRREKERLEEEQRKEDEERTNNLESWAARLKDEQDEVIERIRERKKRRAQLGDRKSAAAQNRMKSIASLAADTNGGKKRKKGEEEKDDGFGRDDSDWAVYREIGGEDDSEAEEDDLAQLESIESRLLQYDPTFTDDDTLEGKVRVKNALLNAFVRGGTDGRYDSESMEQSYQIHLNVERIRVPETWFQPAMFGIDSAGLGEVAGWLMNGFEDDVRKRIMQAVVLTGGSTKLPNLLPRMRNTLTPVLPFREPLKILGAVDGGDPRLEAWRGMAEWASSAEAKASRVTRAEYDEYGGEWLKEHAWGNVAI